MTTGQQASHALLAEEEALLRGFATALVAAVRPRRIQRKREAMG